LRKAATTEVASSGTEVPDGDDGEADHQLADTEPARDPDGALNEEVAAACEQPDAEDD
jgi:hypothetical protein